MFVVFAYNQSVVIRREDREKVNPISLSARIAQFRRGLQSEYADNAIADRKQCLESRSRSTEDRLSDQTDVGVCARR